MVLGALHSKECKIYFDFDLILKNLPSLLWWKVFYYKKDVVKIIYDNKELN